MRLLLDTHALPWWLDGDTSLSPAAREAIANESNEIFLSAASAWEITTNYRLGLERPLSPRILSNVSPAKVSSSCRSRSSMVRRLAPCQDRTVTPLIGC